MERYRVGIGWMIYYDLDECKQWYVSKTYFQSAVLFSYLAVM